MPRQSRIDHPGLLHHVMARGIERRAIFHGPRDYEDFISRLDASFVKVPTQILAWVLMPNHFHLLIRSGPSGLVPFMRTLMAGYAVAFNLRHKRAGHLFQNRYKSIICEDEPYLLELVRYIHLNPLRAGLVNSLEGLREYPYSGHRVLLGASSCPWQNVEEVLGRFSIDPNQSKSLYETFVQEGISRGRRPELMGGGLARSQGGRRRTSENNGGAFDSRILGSGTFVEKILDCYESKVDIKEQLAREGVTLKKVAQWIAKNHGFPVEKLFERGRKAAVSCGKSLLMHVAVEYFGEQNRNMARMTHMTESAASRSRIKGSLIYKQSPLKDWLEKAMNRKRNHLIPDREILTNSAQDSGPGSAMEHQVSIIK